MVELYKKKAEENKMTNEQFLHSIKIESSAPQHAWIPLPGHSYHLGVRLPASDNSIPKESLEEWRPQLPEQQLDGQLPAQMDDPPAPPKITPQQPSKSMEQSLLNQMEVKISGPEISWD